MYTYPLIPGAPPSLQSTRPIPLLPWQICLRHQGQLALLCLDCHPHLHLSQSLQEEKILAKVRAAAKHARLQESLSTLRKVRDRRRGGALSASPGTSMVGLGSPLLEATMATI